LRHSCGWELTRVLEVFLVRLTMLEAPEPWEEDSGSEELARRVDAHRCRQKECYESFAMWWNANENTDMLQYSGTISQSLRLSALYRRRSIEDNL